MEIALVKTLAHKLRISVNQVYRRYRTTTTINGRDYRILRAEITTEHRHYSFDWGGIPLTVERITHDPLNDHRRTFEAHQYYEHRSELITRLQAYRCELCDTEGPCEVHHVRTLVVSSQ